MINKQILTLFQITDADYVFWCGERKLPCYNKNTKDKYFKFLINEFLKKGC